MDCLVFVNLNKGVRLQVWLLIQYTVVVGDHPRELNNWRWRLTLNVESGLRLSAQQNAVLVSIINDQIGVGR